MAPGIAFCESRLDGVVSNAGMGMGGTPLHEYEMADYDRIFSLNSEGVFAGMKYGAEAIFKSKSEGGFLINVASVAGLMPQSGQALYTATKFGVIGMTRVAAMDYAKYMTGKYYGDDDGFGIHPFMCGDYPGALIGDKGDDALLMCGRCQDFGTYRCEKELDVCDWDIVGSELCRTTTMSLQGQAKAARERRPDGPTLDYMMVEAKGCGDRHCRIIAENREKYPAPPHALWERFGPAVTDDYKKYTQEEDTVEESMMFREECNYHFVNGTNNETDSSNQMMNMSTAASLYVLPAIAEAVKRGYVTQTQADHILWCVLEAAGKAMFGERYAIKGLRDWMGVPNSLKEDGRLLAGLIEMQLQALVCSYKVEAFNEKECILVIDRSGLEITGTKNMPEAHVAMWYGMSKTLINAQWSCWEEDSPERKLRIKIAKKIDKFA